MQQSLNNTSEHISRRDFLKISAVSGLSLGLGIAFGRRLLNKSDLVKVTETHYLMGTVVNFSIFAVDESQGKEAIQKTRTEMERLISIFDHRHPDTQLTKLNRRGYLRQPSSELVILIQGALNISTLTSGAFDITVKPLVDSLLNGKDNDQTLLAAVDYNNVAVNDDEIRFTHPNMSITLDGIAKGRVVDGGVAVPRSLGFENVLVEAGGDLLTSSEFSESNIWNIGIHHPRANGETDFITTFSVSNKAVATSGDYIHHLGSNFLQHHIVDPRNGLSPTELASVTVIAATATDADALSTALMVLGVQDGSALTEKLPGVEALFVTKDQAIYRSTGFPTT